MAESKRTYSPSDAINRLRTSLAERLATIYADEPVDRPALLEKLVERTAQAAERLESAGRPSEDSSPGSLWNERDVLLITYGDQVETLRRPAMAALDEFLRRYDLQEVLRYVHLLPFYPYSSDDGFSVIDYRQVEPTMGDWPDVERLGQNFRLTFDLVLNHCSAKSEWFRRFLASESPYDEYFVTSDPASDLSQVVRPRSLPLLTEFQTTTGPRHVWTTFSADQVDLNFRSPHVLLEMVDILLGYAERGARMIRLDAIAYLWKEVGTSCIHLPQTHAVVKLLRDVVDALPVNVLLLSETNVPHRENLSYFGAGDEAHIVYQFSLPPLLLDASLSGDSTYLYEWLHGVGQAPENATFLNFTASHDGIGVRPLEGLVPDQRIYQLGQAVLARGGRINTRRRPDGSDSPYELNITYFDALDADSSLPPDLHVRRFLTTQAIMLALKGLPAVYFQSLVGGRNDYEGLERSGHNRRINRRKFDLGELCGTLDDSSTTQHAVFSNYRRLLARRNTLAPLHPNGAQRPIDLGSPRLLGVERTSVDGASRLLLLANFEGESAQATLPPELRDGNWSDAFDGSSVGESSSVRLEPYGFRWLIENGRT
ncbi:MAG TPA: sugar phosphorylase [Pirellulaceae bacterium]|jgi:sucrose phosphorylase|nr:sugar phosphorylase [Pirellulaceae bacterium]